MTATGTIEALAEPTRRMILDALRQGEQPVHALVDGLAMSQPLVSKHLRVLRNAGLVEVRSEAQRRLYSLRLDPLMELDEWLDPYRQMWCESLDRLEAHLSSTSTSASKKPNSRRKKR